ncbi:MAG TPA: hypothetical protein EYQ50_14245 [Verrucomicrobiales bacterium]|nr:hypothetical protein [Verrucomicrobiales bacterium]
MDKGIQNSLRLCIGIAILWILGSGECGAQTGPEIQGESLRIQENGRLTFLFTSAPGNPEIFSLQTSKNLSPGFRWKTPDDTIISEIEAGLYSVVTLAPTKEDAYYRIVVLSGPGVVLLINEVMSRNVGTGNPVNGLFHDWIEIYNPHDFLINLTGYGLSDNPENLAKWVFPDISIQPRSFLLVYASGSDESLIADGIHARFQLANGGETLVLSDAFGTILDRLRVPAMGEDQSIGRLPDGGQTIHLYSQNQTTPGKENFEATLGAVNRSPEFSLSGGFFDEGASIQLEITNKDPESFIYYSLDGSPPDASSTRYVEPIAFDRTTVVRAVTLKSGTAPSEIISETFFFGVEHELPILSLATDPKHFEFKNGFLYGMSSRVVDRQGRVLQNFPFSGSNAWQDREVGIFMEFYEPDGKRGFRMDAGMKIFGGWGSRGYPQKSLALFARSKYGQGKIKHRIFKNLDLDEFEAIVLRNSGNDNQSTHQTPARPPIQNFDNSRSYGSYFVNGNFTLMRDAMMQELIRDTGLDTQAYRPTVVYINGAYWGIYNIREKLNEAYLLSHYGLEKGHVDLIEGYGSVRAGSGGGYQTMVNTLRSRNLADAQQYSFVVNNILDVDNFIDYCLSVIYFQNFDIGNTKSWRPRTRSGKFRWLVYDQDYGFNLWKPDVYIPAMARDYSDYENMFDFYTNRSGSGTGWPNSGGRTLLLRRMLLSPIFLQKFLTRCADLLNRNFRPDKVRETIHTMAEVIRPEMADHLQRWSWEVINPQGFGAPHQSEFEPFVIQTWEKNLETLTEFADARPEQLRTHAIRHFKLKKGVTDVLFKTEPAQSGNILANTLRISELPWSGSYFADFPVNLAAVPRPGFRFLEWTGDAGDSTDRDKILTLPAEINTDVTAVFETIESGFLMESGIRITEIQYHPAVDQNTGDWVELTNFSETAVALKNWIFRDSNDDREFLLPDQALEPGDSLVLSRNLSAFQRIHPAVTNVIDGSFLYGLSNGGDSIRLYDSLGNPIQLIEYDDEAPWPLGADGQGFTLQLISPDADAALADSWKLSEQSGGTPGSL